MAFLELPPEVRNRIYDYYVTEEEGYVYNFNSGKLAVGTTIANRRPIDQAFVFTCKQIAKELEGLGLSCNTVKFSTAYSDELRVKAARLQAFCSILGFCLNHGLVGREPNDNSDSDSVSDSEEDDDDVQNLRFNEAMIDMMAQKYPQCKRFSTPRLQTKLLEIYREPPLWLFNPTEDDFKRLDFGLEQRRTTADYWAAPHVDSRGKRCYTQGKYRFSAASVAIYFLNNLPKHLRVHLRSLYLHEDAVSVAWPESHAKGLIRFCIENPRLRVERRVELWENIFQASPGAAILSFVFEEVLIREDRMANNRETERQGLVSLVTTHLLSLWIMEANALIAAGMPESSFTPILSGDCSDVFQTALQHASMQAAWEMFVVDKMPGMPYREFTKIWWYSFDGFPQVLKAIVQKKSSLIKCTFDPGPDLWDGEVEFRNRSELHEYNGDEVLEEIVRTFHPPDPLPTFRELLVENILPEFFTDQEIKQIDEEDEWFEDLLKAGSEDEEAADNGEIDDDDDSVNDTVCEDTNSGSILGGSALESDGHQDKDEEETSASDGNDDNCDETVSGSSDIETLGTGVMESKAMGPTSGELPHIWDLNLGLASRFTIPSQQRIPRSLPRQIAVKAPDAGNISAGVFYDTRGWHELPSSQSVLHLKSPSQPSAKRMFPATRLLKAIDVPELCNRDTKRLKNTLESGTAHADKSGTFTMSIIPTHDLISWLHDRAEFISSKMNGSFSQFKGSYSEEGNAWLYWYHDFRRNELVIQRLSLDSRSQASVKALASLLLDARNEAAEWNFPKLVIWSPSTDVQRALDLISQELRDEHTYERQRQSPLTMIRLKGSDTSRKLKLRDDEFFARN
ncbi:hypothetical protein HJFPF1_06085 [Paramyrothecium foliicola]|nr:hypothetical protein HJFPF1_06085 [Paramyrothecium foliicola]